MLRSLLTPAFALAGALPLFADPPEPKVGPADGGTVVATGQLVRPAGEAR